MSEALVLHQIHLSIANQTLLKDVNLVLPLPSKTAIIGANGTGKSTLIQMLSGNISPDQGAMNWPSHCHIEVLDQNPQLQSKDTIFSCIARGLGERGDAIAQWHLNPEDVETINNMDGWPLIQSIEACLREFNLASDHLISTLSEGQKRKVAFARAVISQPDVILLDEPTNHLDMSTIDWLIQWCQNFKGSLIIVSHDRYFIDQTCHNIIEIDHQSMMRWSGNFSTHQQRKIAYLQDLEKARDRLDIRLKEEQRWLERGVTARRRRNMGRLRALDDLKKQRQALNRNDRTIQLSNQKTTHAAQKLMQFKQVSFAYERNILSNFNFNLMKGDHIGIIGPNGCGKSTFIQLMMGTLAPTSGEIIRSDSLNIVYFDQKRATLDLSKTLYDNVGGGLSHIEIEGKKKHIISYLEDFLFTPDRINTPMKRFSGGEKHRALLAKLFLQPANCYILDEPTNDLDIETIEALETFLIASKAAVIVVSHDRTFIDHMAHKTLFYNQNQFIEYAGGYEDAILQGAICSEIKSESSPKKKNVNKEDYKARRKIEDKITKEESKLKALEDRLTVPEVYNDIEKITEIKKKIKVQSTLIEALYDQWSLFDSN